MTTAPAIQSGNILFPKMGCEDLLIQMLGFGVEKHDDLVDALTLLMLKLISEDSSANPLVFPGSLSSQKDETKTKNNLEKEADETIAGVQNLVRSGYDPAVALLEKHKEAMRRYEEARKNEERNLFNQMTHR